MDVVITYVNITNRFKEQYNKYVKKELEENRFRSYDTLELQVKGIRKYLPYIKNIFIVVSELEQVEGLNLSDCKIITHDMIIPSKYLPCFNSCTIEMFLHKIPELDEEFLYFNDDMFIIDNVPSTYWFKNGKPCLSPEIYDFDIKNNLSTFNTRCFNSTQLVAQILKINNKYKNKLIKQSHCPKPYLKSTCNKVFNKNIFYILHSLTRTRHSKNYNCYLFNDYDYLSDNCNIIKRNYIYLENESINDIINTINKKEYQIICINDNNEYINFIKFKTELKNSLESNILNKKYEIPIEVTQPIIDEFNLSNKYEKLIISLTSYPARIKYVKDVLESLVNQDVPYNLYHIVLVLAIPEFPNKENDLPDELIEFINLYPELIEILWYERNIKSHKKLIPTLKKYPNNPILVCDDDVYRPQCWLKMFICDHYKYPNDIIFGTSSWYFGDKYKLMRFKEFKCESSGSINNLPSQIFKTAKPANGLGGCLYPANTFTDKRFFDENLFMKLSPTSDESWQYCFNIMDNKTFRQTSKIIDYSKYFLNGTQEINTSLHKVNNYTEINERLFNEFPKFKKSLNKRMKEFIISFTTHGIRVKYINKTLNSLLNQTLKPYKIVLTLFKEDEKYLTNETLEIISKNKSKIDLIICDENLGPHTKYFYAMKKYKNYAVITVDDDHEYDNDLCESLWKSYINHPNLISARRVHFIKRDINGNTLPYREWKYNCKNILKPNIELFATGVGGVIYPPDILKISDDNLPEIRQCLWADDIYLKWLENKLNISIIWCKNNNPEGNRINEEDIINSALYKVNTSKENGRNDKYLKIFKL